MKALLPLLFIIYTEAYFASARDDAIQISPFVVQNYPKKGGVLHKSLKLLNRRYAKAPTNTKSKLPDNEYYTVFPSNLQKKPLDVPSSPFFSLDNFDEPKLRVKKVLPDYWNSQRKKRSPDAAEVKEESVKAAAPVNASAASAKAPAAPVNVSAASVNVSAAPVKVAAKPVKLAAAPVKLAAAPEDAAVAPVSAKVKPEVPLTAEANVSANVNAQVGGEAVAEVAGVASASSSAKASNNGTVVLPSKPSKLSKPAIKPRNVKPKAKRPKVKSNRNATSKKKNKSNNNRIRKQKLQQKRKAPKNGSHSKSKSNRTSSLKGSKKVKVAKVPLAAAKGPAALAAPPASAPAVSSAVSPAASPAVSPSAVAVAAASEAPANRTVRASRRLIAGRDTLIESYPYVVSIQKNDEHWCTGALLNQRLVITTANCLWKANRMSRLKVRAGSRHTESGGQLVNIAEVMKHPKWSIRSRPDNDVALVLTDRYIKFSHSCHGVDLPNKVMMPLFDDAWIASWGANRRDGIYDKQSLTLQVIHAQLMDRSKCNNITMRFGISVSENFICLEQNGKRAPCTRDTGAPAVSDGVIWGLASWGIRKLCGTERFPAVYSYLASASNMDFIINASKSLMSEERLWPFPDRFPAPPAGKVSLRRIHN